MCKKSLTTESHLTVKILSLALYLCLGTTHRENQFEKRVIIQRCRNLFTPKPQSHGLLLKHREEFQDMLSAWVQLFSYHIPYLLKKDPLLLYILHVYTANLWL